MAGLVLTFVSIFTFVYCVRKRSKIADSNEIEEEECRDKEDFQQQNIVSEMHNEEISDNKIFHFKENVERFD